MHTSRRNWAILIVVLLLLLAGAVYFSRGKQVPSVTTATTSSQTSTVATTSPHSAIHLDIYVQGIALPIPSFATTTSSGENITANPSGVITFVPPANTQTLGNVFADLGERLTPTCFAQFCASETNNFRVYVNGQLYQGDPSMIPLTNDEEVAIVYGTASEIPNPIPATYQFAQ